MFNHGLEHYASIFLKAVFIENLALAFFLGMCTLLALSKNIKTAMGLGIAVILVLSITVPANNLIYTLLLKKGALGWLGSQYAEVDLSFLAPEDQDNMRAILAMKVEDIPTKFMFKVETTDISKTDEAQRQNVLGASQLYSMYGQQLMQLAQMSPELQAKVPEITLQLAYGATELMSSALEKMGFVNSGSFLPFMDDIGVKLDAMDRVRAEQVRQMKGVLNEQSAGAGAGTAGLEGAATNPGAVGAPQMAPVGGGDVTGTGF